MLEIEVCCKHGDQHTIRVTESGFWVGNQRGDCLFLRQGECMVLAKALLIGGEVSIGSEILHTSPVLGIKVKES